MKTYNEIYISPFGRIGINAEGNAVTEVEFLNFEAIENNQNKVALKCKKELKEYFEGIRQKFEVKYKMQGTEFQCRVWEELEKIPYGSICSYKDIAIKIGKKEAVRAVANAIGKNKLCIIVPCHRVIGKNGKLTGFSAKSDSKTGLELKRNLLELEGIYNFSRM